MQVTQRCHFDPDCMAQQKFIDAGKGGAAKDVCDAGRVEIPGKGFRVCDPLTVGGYQAAFMMPSPLFGSDEGTSEYGPGKLADVWVGGVAKVTFRNTGCLAEILDCESAASRFLGLESAKFELFE